MSLNNSIIPVELSFKSYQLFKFINITVLNQGVKCLDQVAKKYRVENFSRYFNEIDTYSVNI